MTPGRAGEPDETHRTRNQSKDWFPVRGDINDKRLSDVGCREALISVKKDFSRTPTPSLDLDEGVSTSSGSVVGVSVSVRGGGKSCRGLFVHCSPLRAGSGRTTRVSTFAV